MEKNKKFEFLLQQGMKEKGWIIPQTIEDVFKFEKELAKNPIDLPPELANTDDIFSRRPRGKLNVSSLPKSEMDADSMFAQAARNGKEIPEDVREKMKQDRFRTEKDKND